MAPSNRTWENGSPHTRRPTQPPNAAQWSDRIKALPLEAWQRTQSREEQKPGGFKQKGTPNEEMMDSLSGYLDNMAAAAMNGGSAFEQYMLNFTKLSDNNTSLANTVNKQ